MAKTKATTIGSRLRRLRLANGLTQEALAVKAGVSFWCERSIEQERVKNPKSETISALARALGATTDEMLGGKL